MNDQFEQLTQYIKAHMQHGISEDKIRQDLLDHNWAPEIVDFAFGSIHAEPLTPRVGEPIPQMQDRPFISDPNAPAPQQSQNDQYQQPFNINRY